MHTGVIHRHLLRAICKANGSSQRGSLRSELMFMHLDDDRDNESLIDGEWRTNLHLEYVPELNCSVRKLTEVYYEHNYR